MLIIQSFSHHIDDNAEKLRHMLVDFEGKKQYLFIIIYQTLMI